MRTETNTSGIKIIFSITYIAFTLLGLMFFFLFKENINGIIYLALALAFDPFDHYKKWEERPLYQRIIPIVHLIVVATIFVCQIILD